MSKEDAITKNNNNSKGKKEKFVEKKKCSNNYLIRRAKKILLESLLKFDNEVISKVYDNIIRIYDGVGITGREIREIVNRSTANKNKYGDKYNVVVVDEMFNISLQFVGAANIFDDNSFIIILLIHYLF